MRWDSLKQTNKWDENSKLIQYSRRAAKEAARFNSALAGGLAGAKLGALAFVWAGPWGMGIAGIVGGSPEHWQAEALWKR